MLLKKMKASLAVALVMSMSLLTACGGSAEKKAAQLSLACWRP